MIILQVLLDPDTTSLSHQLFPRSVGQMEDGYQPVWSAADSDANGDLSFQSMDAIIVGHKLPSLALSEPPA